METRCSEFTKRPAAFEELGKSLQLIKKILELCAQKVRFYIIEWIVGYLRYNMSHSYHLSSELVRNAYLLMYHVFAPNDSHDDVHCTVRIYSKVSEKYFIR